MNIFHWLYIALPRLIFLASGRFSDTTLLFTYQPSQFQLDTLKHAGINCIIGIVSDIGFYEVEKLLFPTHFDRAFCSNSYVNTLRMLYSNLINRDGSTIKIIFPNRNSSLNKRMPSNFGAFNDFINRRAAINIDFSRYSFSEQINFVARAELFLFEHGAAGALIPFTNPKCRIIELLPEGAAYSIYGLPPHYMYLSFASERDYFPVYSRKLGSGFDYDLERLEELLF
jgi:capsular polysaccharide biosynthesis protein